MWRSNAVMYVIYVTVPYNKVMFSVLFCFLTSQSEIDFGIALVEMSTRYIPW